MWPPLQLESAPLPSAMKSSPWHPHVPSKVSVVEETKHHFARTPPVPSRALSCSVAATVSKPKHSPLSNRPSWRTTPRPRQCSRARTPPRCRRTLCCTDDAFRPHIAATMTIISRVSKLAFQRPRRHEPALDTTIQHVVKRTCHEPSWCQGRRAVLGITNSASCGT